MTLCNENFLSPSGFKLVIPGFESIAFQCTSVNLPGVSMGGPMQATPYNDFQLAGDKLNYDDLSVTFLVDESCTNYSLIHNWMVGMTYPQKSTQWRDFAKEMKDKNYQIEKTSDEFLDQVDIDLHILNSNFNISTKAHFYNAFPVSLTPMEYSTEVTDIEYLRATITFKYTYFKLLDKNDKQLTL